MISLMTPVWFVEAIVLDILSLPGKLMSKKGNAEWHLKYVCPYCSKHRKKFRDPKGRGEICMWKDAWEKRYFIFSRDFGFFNWLRYYAGLMTNLNDFKKEYFKIMKRD